ncbi:MAG: ArnT family glycosyltransferase [Candidatus Aquicultorales bacterium]
MESLSQSQARTVPPSGLPLLKEFVSSYLDALRIGGVITLAVLVRIAWVAVTPNVPATDFGGYLTLGKELADGTIPWTIPSNFFWTPGYPYFLAPIFKIFGAGLTVARAANLVLSAATIFLVHNLALRFFDRRAAIHAALIYALFPTPILFTALSGTETLFTFLLLAFLIVWLNLVERGGWARSVTAGALLGFAALVRSQALFLLGILAVFYFFKRPARRLQIVAVALVAFVLVLPWLFRTYELFGTFNMQANGGIFLWQGNHENATLPAGDFPWQAADLPYKPISGEFYASHPKEASDWGYKKVYEFVLGNPLAASRGVVVKAAYFMFGRPDGAYWNAVDDWSYAKPVFHEMRFAGFVITDLVYSIELVAFRLIAMLAFVGMALCLYLRKARFLLVPLAAWLSIHALTIAMARYRFPIYPIFSIYAAFALAAMADAARALKNA